MLLCGEYPAGFGLTPSNHALYHGDSDFVRQSIDHVRGSGYVILSFNAEEHPRPHERWAGIFAFVDGDSMVEWIEHFPFDPSTPCP